jgi:MFS family permease
LVGGFLYETIGWRWLYWLQLILSGCCFLLCALTVPETYAPTILLARAKKVVKDTGDSSYVTEQQVDGRPLSETLRTSLIRPFQLLFQELIVLLLALYAALLYGLLYMFFVA